jgi:SagB-type dehydrogenase family enzyme
MTPPDKKKSLEEILRYHEETKHRYDRYARSPGYMDWDNQPNPFRFYEETHAINLPLLKKDPQAAFTDLFRRTNNPTQQLNIGTIAGFLELSLGLSAWKAVGESQWSLRVNPSSGNLHPTEAHLVLPQISAVNGGVYHYNPLLHRLEQRAEVSEAIWQSIWSHFGCEGFLIGLSTIFWRESWKYGERAFRYCNHDVGHALAALSFSANLLGWKVLYLNRLSEQAIQTVLGFNKTRYTSLEEEHPDLLCYVQSHRQHDVPCTLPDSIISRFSKLSFHGRPNRLSQQAVNWEIIYETANLTRKPATEEETLDFTTRDWIRDDPISLTAAEIIRQRRSATAFDPGGSIRQTQLVAMLDKTLPREGCAPFDTKLINPSIHLLLFIHRVEGLAPGLYFFFRNTTDITSIKGRTKSSFLWEPVEKKFPLFLLETGNFKQQATMVSCHQAIAGSSAFSLGMIAAFGSTVARKPFCYRHLFWESGMIGQVLYLAAEAYGVRGTGIGCYFDDAVHEIFGLVDRQYQSLYHFTIGRPVNDPRLSTYPPYHHLKDR